MSDFKPVNLRQRLSLSADPIHLSDLLGVQLRRWSFRRETSELAVSVQSRLRVIAELARRCGSE